MLEYLLIFFTLVLFAISVVKAGFLPFPTFLILFFGVSQVLSVLVLHDIIPYDMHVLFDFGGFRNNFLTVQLIYTSVALLAFLSLSGKFRDLRSVDLSGTLRGLLNTKNSSRFLWTAIAIALCCGHLILFLLVCDWDQLWHYDQYLVIGLDPKWVSIFGDRFSDTILKAGPGFAILSCLCVCALFGTRNTTLKIFAGALTIFYFTILLSQHSRAAAFFPVLLAINLSLLRIKGRAVVIPILLLVAAVAFLGALVGRGTDRHGLSSLPETIAAPFLRPDPFYDISQALMDSCQGIMVTAESLQLTADFDSSYKLLAFSPLPSYFDDYGTIRDASEHRLHDYVPMSGIGEVYHFGWPYAGFLFICYIVLIRLHTKIAKNNPAIFILCNLLVTMSIYILFAYPLRNALRFYWIAVALVVAADFMARMKSTDSARRALKQRNDDRNRLVHPSDPSPSISSK
jgi:hypothetical protein